MDKLDNTKLKEIMANPITQESQQAFFEELKNVRLLVPIEITSNSFDFDEMEVGKTLTFKEPLRFKLLTISKDDKTFLPLFTDNDALEKMGRVNVMNYTTEDLANLLAQQDYIDETVINPNTATAVGFSVDYFIYNAMVE